MRMKAEFMGTLEVVGEITRLQHKGDWLIMNVSTTVPTGWNLRAAFTHQDIMTMMKFMFKPSVLRYIIFGAGKPGDKNQRPEY